VKQCAGVRRTIEKLWGLAIRDQGKSVPTLRKRREGWGTRKGKCRFSGFRSPVDSTGVQTPDLAVPIGNASGLLGMAMKKLVALFFFEESWRRKAATKARAGLKAAPTKTTAKK
jgi:hypothetical protein